MHLGQWKLVAHGDFFAEQPSVPPQLELYDLAADPAETTDASAGHGGLVVELYRRLREFGSWQKSGVTGYHEGREGFMAPKDWIIE